MNEPLQPAQPHHPQVQDRLDGVTLFVEVVQAGSFARTAELLGLTRSAVGKAIARLEVRLGVRLFHRSTRIQKLTDDGQIYYERCLRAIDELKLAEAQIESGRAEVAGRLRVSCPVLFGRDCVAPILLAYAKEHPKLELHLSFSDQPVDLLAGGFDLGIRMGTLGHESDGLKARKLVNLHKILCASPEYLAERGTPQSIEDLNQHDVLLYRRADYTHTWQMVDPTGQIIDVPLRSRLSFDDLDTIAYAAHAGMGLAWLPEWLVYPHLQTGRLVAVLEDISSLDYETHALWPDTPHMPLRLRLAIDALVAQLPQYINGQLTRDA